MNIKYSIDKVRLRAYILANDYVNNKGEVVKEGFSSLFSRLRNEPYCEYREMYGISAFRHNFNIKDFNSNGDKCSFWIGCSHNSRGKSDVVDVTIDYNPNKCHGSVVLEYFMSRIFKNNSGVEVKEFDLAMDIPCNILDIAFTKSNKSYRLFDNGSDDKTHYFGARGSDGAIKIYNKKRESGLDYELTRYEISVQPKSTIGSMASYSFEFDKYIHPVTCVTNLQLDAEISGQDKFNVLAALDNPVLLSLLDKRKARKIKNIINNLSPVVFDVGLINECISTYFSSILGF